MTPGHVLIAGAGVAGLTAAYWLARAGWSVRVLENAPDLRHGGYMMGLSGPGYETARRMGLLPRLEACSFAVEENVYRNPKGGEIARLRYRDFIRDLPYLALLRTDLVRELRDALPASVALDYSTRIEAIIQDENAPETVRATLSTGEEVGADLVIGAEGLRSATRRLVFGPDETFLRPLGYRFAVYDIEAKLEPGLDFVSYVEPGHMAEYYRLTAERIAALHVWRCAESGQVVAGSRWDVLRTVTRSSHPFVTKHLATASALGDSCVLDDLVIAELPSWSSGHVLLLGDAAHSLTLVSGQGAGMAMASAEKLAHTLAEAPIDAALALHEASMRPSIERLQGRAKRSAAMFIPASPIAFHLRNAVIRHAPRRWLGHYLSSSIREEVTLAQ
ncbi:2-polyprenyl-6-methoxyphenol hydroxylase [Aureimonas ureilytica]|uniref:2-polyprenyl-6-methoxyphenol hydroxylase n=1 Tax=Aureimonas ureilytica TaxID=401562 RepID=A0A175RE00_9HYPH|nr:FAD-dependent oxidoreductase [Aureimonas ureilytica]KTQ97523.1 2-polyprenyl-6-methoxyphenol hydroxylase [Aureimonas ureilytica]